MPQDDRLVDGAPMRPLACRRCGIRVLVRKSSWQQTSVQWDASAAEGCAERVAGPGRGPAGFEGCPALSASIRDAAVSGALEVPQD